MQQLMPSDVPQHSLRQRMHANMLQPRASAARPASPRRKTPQSDNIFLRTVWTWPATKPLMTYDQTANGKQIEPAVGEDFEVSLPETRTAGYRWALRQGSESQCPLLNETSDASSA